MTTYATDDFTGTDGAAWSATWATARATTGASLQINTNRGRMLTGTTGGYAGKIAARISGLSVANVDITGTLSYLDSSIDHSYEIWHRTDTAASSANGYFFKPTRGGTVSLYKAVSSSYTSLDTASFSISATTDYGFRFQAIGTAIKAKIWLASGSEPETWTLEATDSSISSAGSTLILLQGGNTSGGRGEVDNITVTDGTGNSLTFTASMTPTGALSKSASKFFAASMTPSGVYSALKVVERLFTGAMTATGALVKMPMKVLTGAMTPTGVQIKELRRTFTAAMTPTGAFQKSFVRIFAGAMTPTGAVSTTFLGRIAGRAGYAAMRVYRVAEARLHFRRG